MEPPGFRFKFSPDLVYWASKQSGRTKDLQREYLLKTRKSCKCILPFLGKPKVVLDLGCGIGRISVYLHAVLGRSDIYWVLADTSSDDSDRRDGWHQDPYFYNDLKATEEFVRLNGIEQFRVFDVRRGEWSSLPKVDLVVSMYAVGFHCPIEPSMVSLLKCAAPACTMIFCVRKGKYDENSFSDLFSRRKMVVGANPLKERILVLRRG